ncbi:MAG: hypothetical protein ACR2NH_12790, partial [Solirubrobacteraceae bacterium]
MAVTAIALGVIGVVLGVLAIIGWALALALSGEVRDELEKQRRELGRAARMSDLASQPERPAPAGVPPGAQPPAP